MDHFEAKTSRSGEAASMASVRVLFFGKVGDVFGRSIQVQIPTVGCSLAEVRARAGASATEGAAALTERGVRAAVDQQVSDDEVWVRPGQEVAFFSMFSGG